MITSKKSISLFVFLFSIAFTLCNVNNTFSLPTHRVAILPFYVNSNDSKFYSLSNSVPEMLMTDLGKSQNIKIVERLQIDRALHNFRIEQSPYIDQSTAVKVGQWLGSTAVIIGSITVMWEKVRIDARVIDNRTGIVLDSSKVEGNVNQLSEITDSLASRLIYAFTEEKASFSDAALGKVLLNKEYTISPNNNIEYKNSNTIASFLNFRVWTQSENVFDSYMRKVAFNFNNKLDFAPNINPLNIKKGAEYRVSDEYLLCVVKIINYKIQSIEYAAGTSSNVEDVFKWIKVRVVVENIKE